VDARGRLSRYRYRQMMIVSRQPEWYVSTIARLHAYRRFGIDSTAIKALGEKGSFCGGIKKREAPPRVSSSRAPFVSSCLFFLFRLRIQATWVDRI
jgi:hypothetical protein